MSSSQKPMDTLNLNLAFDFHLLCSTFVFLYYFKEEKLFLIGWNLKYLLRKQWTFYKPNLCRYETFLSKPTPWLAIKGSNSCCRLKPLKIRTTGPQELQHCRNNLWVVFVQHSHYFYMVGIWKYLTLRNHSIWIEAIQE